MKKNKYDNWVENADKKKVILGDFKNEYGERFVLYYWDYPTIKNIILITGDELDWEEGYVFNGDRVYKPFKLSDDELKYAKRILKLNRKI